MKRFILIISILSVVLTFAGTGYVLFNHGQVSSGYAIVPMTFAIANQTLYWSKTVKENKNKNKD